MEISTVATQNFGKIIASKKMNSILCKEFESTKMTEDMREFWKYKINLADCSLKYDIHVDDEGKAIVKDKQFPTKKISTHYCKTPLESLFSAIQTITQ